LASIKRNEFVFIEYTTSRSDTGS